MIMFPQRVNKNWVVVSWDKETLHAEVYKSFFRAALEYNKQIKGK